MYLGLNLKAPKEAVSILLSSTYLVNIKANKIEVIAFITCSI